MIRTITRRGFSALGGSALVSRVAYAAAGPKIRVAVGPHLPVAAFHLAVEKGEFTAEGLEIETLELPQQSESLALLASGKVDVYLGTFTASIANLIARGARIRIAAGRDHLIAGCGEGNALWIRKARFPKGANHAASWKGARGAITTIGNYREYGFHRLAVHLGLQPGDIAIERMRQEEALAAAARGALDIITSVSRPGQKQSSPLAGFERTNILEQIFPDFQYGYILFGAAMLNGPVEAGAGFLRAYLRGARGWRAGESPKWVETYAKASGGDAKLLKAECRRGTQTSGQIRMADMQVLLNWAMSKNYIERPIRAADCVDPRFLEALSQAKGKPA